MPRDVSVIEETSTSVTLTVALPIQLGRLPITHWTIKYEVDGRDLETNGREMESTSIEFPHGRWLNENMNLF